MSIFESITGMIKVEIKTASTYELLTAISRAGIPVFDLLVVDALTISIRIKRTDYKELKALLEKRNEEISIKQKTGTYWSLRNFCKRPLLIVGICILFFLTIFLPTRILFVRVEGNKCVPTQQILEEAERTGICFGTSRRSVRSERIKNTVLSYIPQLQWVGINTYGCVAVISVQERTPADVSSQLPNISSVVADWDGIIQSMVVTRGTPMCSVGQAVYKDQVLVSAYTDCGSVIKATRAEAEIIARTYRKIDAITPKEYIKKGKQRDTTRRYGIRIGKKLIKLYKDSGISGITCDKIYSEHPIKLPGGFYLPIALISEETHKRDIKPITEDDESDYSWMHYQSESYLVEQLTAAEIVSRSNMLQISDGVVRTSGQYVCCESIGVSRNEEIDIDGQRN